MVAAASAPDDSLRAAAIRDSLAPPADTLRELPATDDLSLIHISEPTRR